MLTRRGALLSEATNDEESVAALATYLDRYVAQGRCPADDRLLQGVAG